MSDPERVLRTVHKMFVKCSYQVRNIGRPGRAASDDCGNHADTAVVDGDSRLYRCPQHRGMIDATRTGNVVTAVYVRMPS